MTPNVVPPSVPTAFFVRHGTPATQNHEQKRRGNNVKRLLTIHHNADGTQINLAAGHKASLTHVHALIGLLYATDLKVIVA